MSGTTAGLRGIHSVGGGVAWASGTDGTVLRTEDGGYMWQRCAMPPGAEKLDFRGVWAWDENTAMVMSSGPGEQSRIYKTTDGCSHWTLLFTNPDKGGFWDAFQCFDLNTCYMLGDPVQHEFQLWHTEDGGLHWLLEHGRSPQAESALQSAFAASNSSLSLGVGTVFEPLFGSGGKAGAYFYRSMGIVACSDDCPEHNSPAQYDVWQKTQVPTAGGSASSGIFSLAFRDENHGIAVGGDYTRPNDPAGTAAWTSDGGQRWTAATKPPRGYRSAIAWDSSAKAWIAAGTNGSDISYDEGKTWAPLDDGNWNALSLPWVVGPQGRIAKLDLGKLARK
ncbi:MAG TPA: hypothetical protein VFW25_02990 [Silvibacterium sp.]|nr:hypothetical protein [Silvibacterium sp.]